MKLTAFIAGAAVAAVVLYALVWRRFEQGFDSGG